MLIYLSTNTCPDITFAVSQVARYSNSPRQSHASAMKKILRYLQGTSDLGVTMQILKIGDQVPDQGVDLSSA